MATTQTIINIETRDTTKVTGVPVSVSGNEFTIAIRHSLDAILAFEVEISRHSDFTDGVYVIDDFNSAASSAEASVKYLRTYRPHVAYVRVNYTAVTTPTAGEADAWVMT